LINAESLCHSLDLRKPGVKALEETVGECRHLRNHALPASESVKIPAGPLEHHGCRAQTEIIGRLQKREYGGNQGAHPSVLPVKLIIDVPNRAPSVPEVGVRTYSWYKPLRNLIHPLAVEIT
jgi:hypothetical protein